MGLKAINGLPIIDARRPLTLHITDADISKADRKEPTDCVVARACRRDLHAKEVHVHLGRVYIRTNPGNWVRYMTPPRMRAEIIAYDRGGTFAVGDYNMPAPQPAKKLGKARGSLTNKTKLRRSRKKRAYHAVIDVRASVTRDIRDGR